MWFLSLGLSCFGAVLGQIFYFLPQTVLEEVIPGPTENSRIRTSDSRFWRFMNPGPFNLKEHVAITIMASTASSSALAISIFAARISITTLIGSQLIGYGLAGITRSFLVYPTFAVYPQLIPSVQLFDALHRGKEAVMQKKRLNFFWIIFVGIFVWEWFPTLTGICIFCLANRRSAWFTRIFGGAAGNEGLGVFSISLDWAYVGSSGGTIGALFAPLSTQLSLYGGCLVCIIAFCACFAANTWNTQNFPFLTQLLFYENGTQYNQLAILNSDFTLNKEKSAEQGLPWYAASQLLFKISRTMYIGAAVTHFFLWHFKTVVGIIRDYKTKQCDDAHYRRMKVYKEISNWWYIVILLVTAAISLGRCYAAKSGLPWWGFLLALLFAWMFVPVIGQLNATVGAAIPGKPVANMYFTMYGWNPFTQALNLLRDLKLGQYTKLPPRVTFTVQAIGAIVGGLLNFIIAKVVINSQRNILLEVQETNVWSGQQVQSYNSDAISWGALGKPLYAPGTPYAFVPYMLLVGLLFPIPFWLLHKKYPKVGFNFVFTPVLVAKLGFLSVGINSAVFTRFGVTIFSQYYLRKYRAGWFRKYNFLLSAALDGGTSVMIFVYTFAVGGGSGRVTPFPTWALNPKGNPDYCKRLSK
ncbi:oligopeptide transporter [Gymnopilus junonius]|uniref:Oligopeptide transporter n=1 Tax=Gymnopilus junonius TaxID=109634 RepID=A0A9P5NC71_GYMJU|nr:oligopeptide transporter [Gymnopilus junonius]